MLEFKDFRYDKKRVKELYHEAFPKDEQVPYFALKHFARGHVDFNAVYHGAQFIGFVYNVLYKDIVFLFYFAIKKDVRHQGYGSQILNMMKEKYQGYRILLNIEDIEEHSSNYLERKQRQAFYIKNGFSLLDYKVKEGGVIYQMLCYDKQHREVSEEEYLSLLKDYFGSLWFRYVYLKIRENI